MKTSELSKRVKEVRSRKGISQEQLAVNSGLSLRTIQRIENGETVPRGDTLKRLAAALQVSPDEIVDWQILEDNNLLTMLSLSQLAFIAFPLLGIIIPLAIWILKKDKVKDMDKVGKTILNFQITWVMIFFICCAFIVLFFILPRMLSFDPDLFSEIRTLASIYFGIFMLFYILNTLIIVTNTLRIYRGRTIWYKPAIRFLR